MTDKDRLEVLEELKALYKETCEFIENKAKDDKDFAMSVNLIRANKVIAKLLKYIKDFENKKCLVYRKEYWCNLIAQALYYNSNNVLDDDNFPINDD